MDVTGIWDRWDDLKTGYATLDGNIDYIVLTIIIRLFCSSALSLTGEDLHTWALILFQTHWENPMNEEIQTLPCSPKKDNNKKQL